MTWNVILKIVGPILVGKSTSPITARLEPSNAFTIRVLGFILIPSTGSFIKVVFGMTFSEEHVSTNTLDSIVSMHFKEICRALLWFFPSTGSSSSLKPKKFPVVTHAITSSNCYIVMSFVICVALNTFNNEFLCASELSNRDNMEIFEGV